MELSPARGPEQGLVEHSKQQNGSPDSWRCPAALLGSECHLQGMLNFINYLVVISDPFTLEVVSVENYPKILVLEN